MASLVYIQDRKIMAFLADSTKIARLAAPLLISRLLDVIVFFTGFIVIARLGLNQFAAASLSVNIFITALLLAVGVLFAVGIKISYVVGLEQREQVKEHVHAALLLSPLLSILVILTLLAITALLPYLGQSPTLIPYAKTFLYGCCFAAFVDMPKIVLIQLSTALLRPRIVWVTSMLSAPITILAMYSFILGKFGIPSLGMWGLGLALMLGDSVSIAILVAYILTSPVFRPFHLTDISYPLRNLAARLRELLQLGLPMGIQLGTEIAALSVIRLLIGHYGIHALSASQIANQLLVIVLMIPFTISEATAILVGQSYGQKDKLTVRRYGISSCQLMLIFVAMASALFCLFPKQLTNIYLDIHNPSLADTVSLSTLFLYICAITQLFDGLRITLAGALRGLHDSKYPMYSGMIVLWLIALPLGYLLAFPAHLGPAGLFIGLLIAIIVGAALLVVRFKRKIIQL